MEVVYSNQEASDTTTSSIFLAGPTPRSPDVPSWRPAALDALRRLGYQGTVFVPEYSEGTPKSYMIQVEWEKKYLTMADRILFWVPRELKTMPAFTTNVEFGTWIDSRKVIFGAPPNAPKNSYLNWLYKDRGYPDPHQTLDSLCSAVVQELGAGAVRSGAERYIPLEIWNNPTFSSWYKTHLNLGNELHDARILFRWDIKDKPHTFVFWAKMYIKEEKRYKTNEFVVCRPDAVSVLAYLPGSDFLDTKVLLVREFRTPASNEYGYVVELPGGSSWNPKPYIDVATSELQEEAGLSVDGDRLVFMGGRQPYASMLGHQVHLFVVKLTQNEFDNLALSDTFGVLEDTERTTLRVRTLREILSGSDVDWTTVGMVFQGLSQEIPCSPTRQ